MRYRNEIDSIAKKISDLESTMVELGGGARSVDETQEHLKRLNEERSAAHSRRTNLNNDLKNRTANIASVKQQISDTRESLHKVQMKLVQSQALEQRVEELRAARGKDNAKIEEADAQLAALAPSVSTAEARLREIRSDVSEKERRHLDASTQLSQSDHKLRTIQRSIHAYISDGALTKGAECAAQVRALRTDVDALVARAAAAADALNELYRQEADMAETQRQIVNNLQYRVEAADVERVADELHGLQERHADVHDARYRQEDAALGAKIDSAQRERAGLMTQLGMQRERFDELLGEYRATGAAAAVDVGFVGETVTTAAATAAMSVEVGGNLNVKVENTS